MPATDPNAPVGLLGSRFMLEIDGLSGLPVLSVSGLEVRVSTAETPDYVTSGGRQSRKNPGEQDVVDISVTRHLDENKGLWDWHKSACDGQNYFKNGSVVVYNVQDQETARYNFMSAWPSRVAVSGFDSAGSDTITEEVTICANSIERVK